MDRGYTVEVSPSEKICDGAAGLEPPVESGREEFSGYVKIQSDASSTSLAFVCKFDSREIEVRRVASELVDRLETAPSGFHAEPSSASSPSSEPNSAPPSAPLSPAVDEDTLDFLERTLERPSTSALR